MLRSILSVVAAVVAWGLLWVSANLGLASALPGHFDDAGMTTTPSLLVAMIAISAALSVGAGWLCAAIANGSVMKHVTVLAFIQLAIGVFVQVGVWDLMPVWYHIVFLWIVFPMHLLGGRIRQRSRAALVPA